MKTKKKHISDITHTYPTLMENINFIEHKDNDSNTKEEEVNEEDAVNHPSHYTKFKEEAGVEAIEITRHLDFDRGNAIKYILRCGEKEKGNIKKAIEDINKAIWYLNDYKENFLKPLVDTPES